ncbi:hypothetical protein V1951_21705 [Yersinia sp. 2544 StPb PI]|uniref:hypothetical protein n=1 Tax=Yersinia sp. 2544 StPb PI TaxID=3117409 RepID=UPI003B2812D3
MIKYLVAIIALSSFSVSAECWVVANLKGYSAYNTDKYVFDKNAISNGVFHVDIREEKADLRLVGDSFSGAGLHYIPASPASMVGFFSEGDKSTIETWAITKDKKVMYSKVMINPETLNSTSSFVGDVVGKC